MTGDDLSAAGDWCQVTVTGPRGVVLGHCALAGSGAPDLGLVDALARLRLEAIRCGGEVTLSDVHPDLASLLKLVGLEFPPG
jgi:hypothetical protein